jgi:hypothetical protein
MGMTQETEEQLILKIKQLEVKVKGLQSLLKICSYVLEKNNYFQKQ